MLAWLPSRAARATSAGWCSQLRCSLRRQYAKQTLHHDALVCAQHAEAEQQRKTINREVEAFRQGQQVCDGGGLRGQTWCFLQQAAERAAGSI
jgi:hypothetical protein